MFNIVVKNAFILDGSGNPWFRADVATEGSKIAKIGEVSAASAERVIDAKGRFLTPGFIDMHSHSDLMLLADPKAESKVMQGVTTEVLGQDGLSVAPVSPAKREELRRFLAGLTGDPKIDWKWGTFAEYLRMLEDQGIALNAACLVGHGTVRIEAVGFDERDPTDGELEDMKKMTAEAMQEGAFGVSSGLIYTPGSFAKTNELVQICKVAARFRGIYVTHIRNESHMVVEATREALEIGEKAQIPVHISHFKVGGKDNWGRVKETLEMVEDARSKGIEVTFDQYPYTAGSTMLYALLPPWAIEGGVDKMLARLKDQEARQRISEDVQKGLPGWEGFAKLVGWENIIVTYCKRNKDYEGKSLIEIANLRKTTPDIALLDLLLEEEASPSMVIFHMSEDDVRTVMRHPVMMVSTDGLLGGKPHPRAYGTYPRILGRYVRELRLLRLEDAIRKMTSLPAQRMGIWDRGIIREGMHADMVIFDAERIIDTATYKDPCQFPEGIEYVLVNGKLIVERGKHTGELAGRVLRKHAR